MVRITDYHALRVNDKIQLSDNSFFRSIGFESITGVVKGIDHKARIITIHWNESHTQRIDFEDGMIAVLDHTHF